jgi:hypothetical protein
MRGLRRVTLGVQQLLAAVRLGQRVPITAQVVKVDQVSDSYLVLIIEDDSFTPMEDGSIPYLPLRSTF